MDIGSLTGVVTIEDQLSEQLTVAIEKVKSFVEEFDGAMGALAIGVSAAVVAVVGITVSIEELGKEGSKILGVENAFDHLAEGAGTTGEVLREDLSAGVRSTVTEMQLMESTAKLLGSGMKLTGDQATLMGTAARELGKATGGDAVAGLDILSGALTTGRTRQLQMQIGLIDVVAGEEKFATSIGTTRTELSAAGLLEGKRIAILDATQGYLDRLGISELSFAEKVKQGWTAVVEWEEGLSKAVASSADVNEALDAIGAAISAAFGYSSKSAMDLIVDGINAFARAVTATVPYLVSFGEGVKTVWTFLSNNKNVIVDITKITVAFGVAWAAWSVGGALVVGIVDGFTAITAGITILTTAIAANPLGAIAVASVAAGLALRSYITSEADAALAAQTAGAKQDALARARQTATEQTKHATAAEDENNKFIKDKTSSIDALVAALEGESKKTLETQMAIERVIASENEDVDVKQRVVDSIDKLIKNHVALSDVTQKYYDDNRQFGTQEIKQAETTAKLWDDYYHVVLKGSHDTTTSQVQDAYLTAQATITQMERAKTITISDYDAIWAKASATADQIIQKTLESDRYSKAYYDKLRDSAEATYEFAMAHSDQYLDRTIQMYYQAYQEAARASATWATHVQSDMDSVEQKAPGVVSAIDSIASADRAAAAAANEAAAAHKKMMDMGNTLDIATAAQDPEINQLLHQGWSLKNAEALKLAHQWGFTPKLYDPLGNPETSPSKGERVPGYILGGPTVAGLSMLHDGEYVVPKDGALVSSGGGGVVVQVYVQGVWDPATTRDMTQRISDEMIRMSGRRF